MGIHMSHRRNRLRLDLATRGLTVTGGQLGYWQTGRLARFTQIVTRGPIPRIKLAIKKFAGNRREFLRS